MLLPTDGLSAAEPAVPEIVTPLGVVRFGAELGDWALSTPDAGWVLPRGGSLSRWRRGRVGVDLVVGMVPARVRAWAAVWHVVANEAVAGVRLFGSVDPAAGVHEDTDSGESLDAVAFTSPTASMTFGGPDADRQFAECGASLPLRWGSILTPLGGGGEYEADLQVITRPVWPLPGLLPGEELRFAFMVAVGEPEEQGAVWEAAEMRIAQALEHLL